MKKCMSKKITNTIIVLISVFIILGISEVFKVNLTSLKYGSDIYMKIENNSENGELFRNNSGYEKSAKVAYGYYLIVLFFGFINAYYFFLQDSLYRYSKNIKKLKLMKPAFKINIFTLKVFFYAFLIGFINIALKMYTGEVNTLRDISLTNHILVVLNYVAYHAGNLYLYNIYLSRILLVLAATIFAYKTTERRIKMLEGLENSIKGKV